MRIAPQALLPPLVAIFVAVVVVQQTSSALRSSGAWRGRTPVQTPRRVDPYTRLDDLVAAPPSNLVVSRDPFVFGGMIRAEAGPANPVRRPVVPTPPPAPAVPVLTSIIFDEDPRATVRYNGRDFSVRQNSLFADFRVASISATQIVLDRGGQPLVLTLGSKGGQQ